MSRSKMVFASLFLLFFSQRGHAAYFNFNQTHFSKKERVRVVEIKSFENENSLYAIYAINNQKGEIEEVLLLDYSGRVPKVRKNIPFTDLVKNEVSIFEYEGYDVIFLHCPKCNAQNGGKLQIKYLYNGIWGTFESFNTQIKKGENLSWNLFQADGITPIKKMSLTPNYSFGQLVGIKKIDLHHQYLKFFLWNQLLIFPLSDSQ